MQHFETPQERQRHEARVVRERPNAERIAAHRREEAQLLHEGIIRPYSHFSRIAYGSWWTFITLALVIGGFAAMVSSPGAGFVAIVLSALAGRYAYRLWTWQARRLVFFIVF